MWCLLHLVCLLNPGQQRIAHHYCVIFITLVGRNTHTSTSLTSLYNYAYSVCLFAFYITFLLSTMLGTHRLHTVWRPCLPVDRLSVEPNEDGECTVCSHDYVCQIHSGSLFKSWASSIRPHNFSCLSAHQTGWLWLSLFFMVFQFMQFSRDIIVTRRHNQI